MAVEITGARVEHGQHNNKLEANVLSPYAGVQTPGFTRWVRKTPGTRLDVEVSRLLVRREALFVRKDGPDVCGSCNEKTACARIFSLFS